MKADTILYYDGTYWKVIRTGYSKIKEEVFYECWGWHPTYRKWNAPYAFLLPANKVRVPGKLEILVALGAKEANGQY